MGVWTEEQKDELRRLRDERVSYAVIASELGVTRGAAIGAGWRMGLRERVRPRIVKQHTPPARKFVSNGNIPARPEPVVTLTASPEPVHFFDRKAGQCAYPLWPPEHKTGNCCGAGTWSDTNYCRAHYQITHTRATQKDVDRMAKAAMRGSDSRFAMKVLA